MSSLMRIDAPSAHSTADTAASPGDRLDTSTHDAMLSETLVLQFSRVRELALGLIKETNELSAIGRNRPSIFEAGFDLAKEVRDYEIRLIKHALVLTKGNQALATKLLGVKPTTLHYKIKTYQISARGL